MEKEGNYPTWICSFCALENGGEVPKTRELRMDHMDICDVCNHWSYVAQPSEFNYPACTTNRNSYKIYYEIMEAIDREMEKEHSNFNVTINLLHYLDEIIHEILEKSGIKYESARGISREQRKSDREKIRKLLPETRIGAEESMCAPFFFN